MQNPVPYHARQSPDWVKHAVIYQINTRQFTPEGTFRAAIQQLPRLKELGVDILWLMPIHPIGSKNRKGKLGSPYAVRDYYGVNPEFGSFSDLKNFIDKAHEMGLYVILDWVANHTAWDNPLTRQNPDWYIRDKKGNFRSTPWSGWSDIIELDYNSTQLREYMTETMCWWVRQANVDGFRADVAGYVPIDFWVNVRRELENIKPVFMLAEWESRELHLEAFDATYAWTWWDMVHDIAMDRKKISDLHKYYAWHAKAFPKGSIRMTFVTNHDKNAWEGSMYENFGRALEAAIVLSVVGDGIPLIHNGQEAGMDKALAFFDKSPIAWRNHPMGSLYQKLFSLKKQYKALWNGHWGAPMQEVPNNLPENVLSFIRQNDMHKVFAVFNFSSERVSATFKDMLHHGRYKDYITEKPVTFNDTTSIALNPWCFKVFIQYNDKAFLH